MKIHVYSCKTAPKAARFMAQIEQTVDVPETAGQPAHKRAEFVPLIFKGETAAKAVEKAENYLDGKYDNESRRKEHERNRLEALKRARAERAARQAGEQP